MRFPVGRVVVLVGVEVAVGIGLVDLAAHADGAVGAFAGIAEDHLRAVGFQDAFALDGGVGRQAQLDLVAAIGADHGVGDAGVAAGGVQDDALGIQAAGALAIQDHVEGGAVLHGAAGVEVFGLGEDLDAGELARRSSPGAAAAYCRWWPAGVWPGSGRDRGRVRRPWSIALD